MDLAALTASIDGQPATAGWDAVCAIDTDGLNRLLLDWYLQDNPIAPVGRLQTAYVSGDVWCLLDAELGPVRLSFPAATSGTTCTVTRRITGGALLLCHRTPTPHIVDAVPLGGAGASLTGTLELTKVTGTTAGGSVQLDLGAGSWTAEVAGLPASGPAKDLARAVAAYYAANPSIIVLGGVGTSKVGPFLQPTSFELATQAKPGTRGDGCVLLLITTNGTPGTVGALPVYPIPDGHSAALLVSNHTLFNGILPSQLSSHGSVIDATAVGSCGTDGVWRTIIQSGTANLGAIEIGAPDDGPYSSNGEQYSSWWSRFWHNGHTQERAVSVPLSGLTVGSSSSGLSASHSAQWQQGWDYTTTTWWGHIPHTEATFNRVATTLTYQASATPVIDPATCLVTFAWSGAPSCVSQLTTDQWRLFKTDPGAAIAAQIVARMTAVFKALTLAEVNTFALQNLLFYGRNALRLTAGSVPADLVLTGNLAPFLAVDPVSSEVTAGDSPVAFSATLGGKPTASRLWQVIPAVGRIDTSGSYTPPPQVTAPTVVQVTATDGTDSGRALVVVMPRPAGGLVVVPANRIAAAGVQLYLTVHDASGAPVTDVSWTIAPAGSGSITPSGDAWAYHTPNQVTAPAIVTLTASTSGGRNGAATVAVVPTVPLTVTTNQTSVKPGAQVTLTASANGIDLTQVRWLLSTPGTGTLSALQGPSITFTAAKPAAGGSTTPEVAAYLAEADCPFALATATITVTG